VTIVRRVDPGALVIVRALGCDLARADGTRRAFADSRLLEISRERIIDHERRMPIRRAAGDAPFRLQFQTGADIDDQPLRPDRPFERETAWVRAVAKAWWRRGAGVDHENNGAGGETVIPGLRRDRERPLRAFKFCERLIDRFGNAFTAALKAGEPAI